jgi:hypothetical protein
MCGTKLNQPAAFRWHANYVHITRGHADASSHRSHRCAYPTSTPTSWWASRNRGTAACKTYNNTRACTHKSAHAVRLSNPDSPASNNQAHGDPRTKLDSHLWKAFTNAPQCHQAEQQVHLLQLSNLRVKHAGRVQHHVSLITPFFESIETACQQIVSHTCSNRISGRCRRICSMPYPDTPT